MLQDNKKQTIVFICTENACRSQMAEAFAIMLKNGGIEIYSAGSKPAEKINQQTILSMKTLNYDIGRHKPSTVHALPKIRFDWLITMGCSDQCPSIQAQHHVAWHIPDPKNMNSENFDRVRNLIQKNVMQLIKTIENSATLTETDRFIL